MNRLGTAPPRIGQPCSLPTGPPPRRRFVCLARLLRTAARPIMLGDSGGGASFLFSAVV